MRAPFFVEAFTYNSWRGVLSLSFPLLILLYSSEFTFSYVLFLRRCQQRFPTRDCTATCLVDLLSYWSSSGSLGSHWSKSRLSQLPRYPALLCPQAKSTFPSNLMGRLLLVSPRYPQASGTLRRLLYHFWQVSMLCVPCINLLCAQLRSCRASHTRSQHRL